MRIWKRVLSAVLVLTLAFSMVSCGGEAPAGDDTAGENTAAGSENTPVDTQESGTAEDNSDKNAVQEGTFVEEDGTVRQVNTFDSSDGCVSIVVDAVIEGYDKTELPVISVSPNYYDSAELKQISEAMADDRTVYAYSENLTKSQLDHVREELTSLIDAYFAREADGARNMTDDEIIERTSEWQELIDHLEEDYVTAPDEIVYTEPVYEYGLESRYDGGKDYLRSYYGGKNTFMAQYEEDGRVMDIIATQSNFDPNGVIEPKSAINTIFSSVNNQFSGSSGYTYPQQTPFTQEEKDAAYEKVMRVVNNMGYGDWKLVQVKEFVPREGHYDFGYFLNYVFVPQYYDVPVHNSILDSWVYSTEEHTDVIARYNAPRIFVSYSNGEILEIGCDNDIDVSAEGEMAQLMPYEAAIEKIYEYASKKWGYRFISNMTKDRDNYTHNLFINKISLEYIRTVSDDETSTTYELLPVWVVYGNYEIVSYYMGNTVISGVQSGNDPQDSMTPMFLINAYDGSLITTTKLNQY